MKLVKKIFFKSNNYIPLLNWLFVSAVSILMFSVIVFN